MTGYRTQDTSFWLPHFPVASPPSTVHSHLKTFRPLLRSSSSHWRALRSHHLQRRHSPDHTDRAGKEWPTISGQVVARSHSTAPQPARHCKTGSKVTYCCLLWLCLEVKLACCHWYWWEKLPQISADFHKWELNDLLPSLFFYPGVWRKVKEAFIAIDTFCRTIWMVVVFVWQF